MAKLPLITDKSQIPAEHHGIVDAIIGSRGSLAGPFSVFLHSPEIAGRMAHLGAYVRFEGSLDFRVRTLAAMVVAREYDALYVWGAQTGVGRCRARAQADAIATNGRVGRRTAEPATQTQRRIDEPGDAVAEPGRRRSREPAR